MSRFWSPPEDWGGHTAFIVGGGPSVAGQPVERLQGHKVIAINTSFEIVPFADYLIFGDERWWLDNRQAAEKFAGTIVTTSSNSHPRVKVMRLLAPPDRKGTPRHGAGWLSDQRDCLVMGFTTLLGALGLARLLGARRIALLGIDLKPGADGRSHHHRPHRVQQTAGCWIKQAEHLRPMAAELAAQGIEIFNCSPDSRATWWPYRALDEMLAPPAHGPAGENR